MSLKDFIIPYSYSPSPTVERYSTYAIVPTHKPSETTIRLVNDLLSWNKRLNVFVVDDCTPESYEKEHRVFERIRAISKRVKVLRTPDNKLKAGAINYALNNINANGLRPPDVIVTLDDDVYIDKNTIQNMVHELMSYEQVGAICSQCRASNKNVNLLTRLQGLEYLGFNAIRLADQGFFRGPLVMHGMLTAFKTKALFSVGGFAERHLIEDYEITARIKKAGWHVKMSPSSYAWTEVPETIGQLWKQRARWTYGGITIITHKRYWKFITQDIVGHGTFLLTFIIIFASLVFTGKDSVPHWMFYSIVTLSIVQALMWYAFQLWYMKFYAEKDFSDWLIRLTLICEFIYANALTLVLIVAYFYHIFNKFFEILPDRLQEKIIAPVNQGFAKIGFTRGWGTKST